MATFVNMALPPTSGGIQWTGGGAFVYPRPVSSDSTPTVPTSGQRFPRGDGR